MAKGIDHYQRLAQRMMIADAERDRAFLAYEQMYHNGWDLPSEIRNLPWIRRVISSDPHDAINAGVRILSTLPASISFQPLAPGTANKDRADMIERNLSWQLKSANRRRSASVESDIVRSALVYASVAAQVVDLEYQIEQKRAIDASTKREEAMRRYGRFMVQTYNPRNVHARYSGMMPEAILLAQIKPAQEVIDEWGARASRIPSLRALADSDTNNWVTYFDYTDYDRRAVWCTPGPTGMYASSATDESMVILNEANEMPFFNWVALMGGSTMESEQMHKYQPLLYGVYTTGVWDTQNIVKTLEVSEVIAHSGSPRFKEEGPNMQESEIDYMSPERIAKVPPQNTLAALAPHEIDRALAEVDSMFTAQIDKSTISRVLQGGELPPGVAFATLNLATQTALGALKPAKGLAEKALAEICTQILQWVEFTDNPLYAYSTAKESMGEEMVIYPDEIAPDAIYIDVELHPDAPTDRQQRVNTAVMAVDGLHMPIERALEDIGITDPIQAMKTRFKERMIEHVIEMRMREMQLRMEAEIQMEQQERMMQMQAEMQMQLGEQQQPGGVGSGSSPPGPAPEGEPTQQFNPAAGGQPPAEAESDITREFMTGQDFFGGEML